MSANLCDRAPVSLQQEHILRCDNRTTHNIPPMVARLRVPFDRGALSAAFAQLLDRHDVLRTAFVEVKGGTSQQVVRSGVAVDIKCIDLSRFERESAVRTAMSIIREQGRTPFDVTAAPLIRAGVIRLGPDETLLWVIVHHLVSDLWSMRLFLRDVNRLYPTAGRAEPLEPLSEQYSDYARWQRRWLETRAWEPTLACWRQRLERAGGLSLPGVPEEPGADTGGVLSNQLGPELSGAVRQLARTQRATPFMTLLSAFQILLSFYSGNEEIVVDTLIANRDRREIEPVIGMYAGTAAVHLSLDDDPAAQDVIRRTRDDCFEVFAHQHLTFRKAVELLEEREPGRRLGRPRVLFSMQKSPVPVGDASDLPISDEPYPGLALYDRTAVDRPLWDQAWQAWEGRNGEFQIITRYRRGAFDRETMSRMFEDYRALLSAMVAQPTERVSGLRRYAGAAMRAS